MVDCFGTGSVEYLTRCWSRGDHFSALLSDSRDFLGTTASPEEVFTPMVVSDLFFQAPRPPWLSKLMAELRPVVAPLQPIHFFRDPTLLPPDTDCTAVGFSLALRAMLVPSARLRPLTQRIAANTQADGIIQVYFDPGGRRDGILDPVVCVNALYLLNQMEVADCASRTEAFVIEHLESRRFEAGSRYYPSADTFLYFLARLITQFPMRYASWLPKLIRQVRARHGMESRPLELAQRILASTRLGLDSSMDAWLLHAYRNDNGSFPPDALFQYGRSSRYFGGEAITTAFAARALTEYGRWLRLSKPSLERWRARWAPPAGTLLSRAMATRATSSISRSNVLGETGDSHD